MEHSSDCDARAAAHEAMPAGATRAGFTAQAEHTCREQRGPQRNVIGVLPNSDPALAGTCLASHDTVTSRVRTCEMARARGLEIERDPGATALVLIASTCGIALFERLGLQGGRFPPTLTPRVVERMWPPVAR